MGIKIDTVVIDPENNSRELILNYLAQIEDINVTQEFNDVLTAMNFITESRPNLIIVDISQKTQMALDIIPDNFLTPFTEGNPMQIVFLGALIGLALLVLGNRADTAAAVAGQANAVIQLIMEGVGFFVPFFIFCSIFQMMESGGIFMIARSYKDRKSVV